MPGETFIWKTTGASLDFAELVVEPGVKPPEHIHHGHDETYFILEGSLRFKLAGEEHFASPGSFVHIPRGTPHAWVNLGPDVGRVILLFTPGGMTGYFDELRPLLPKLMPHLDDLSKTDPDVLAKMRDIEQRYQYELVGPPLS